MSARGIFSFLLALLFVGVLVGIGTGIYQAGLAQGIVEAGRIPAGQVVPVGGYGWGFHGFGFFGLLFPLLFLFLLFGLARAAFSRGRGWGPGYGKGGWGPGYGPGAGGPDAWREEGDRRMSDLHRRLHEAEDAGTAPSRDNAGATGAGPR